MKVQELIDEAPHIIKTKLETLKSMRERPDFHPEPSVFHHIEIVTARLIPSGNPDLILAAILHDICKLDTAKVNEKTGWPTSPGHDRAAYELILNTESIHSWIVQNGGNVSRVMNICLAHMKFHQLKDMRETKREANIQKWKDQGIWHLLQIFGAADNMLVEFDLNNLDKSWKFNEK